MEKSENEEYGERTKVTSTKQEISLEFDLDEEQKKAVIECIKTAGKVSIKLGPAKISKLPGRGLLDDTEGELID